MKASSRRTIDRDGLIRPAARHEIPEIERLHAAAYAQYRDDAPPAIFEAYDRDLRNLARYWDEAEVFVADIDRRMAGAVLFYADASSEGLGLPPGWAGFRKLAVHPAMRGKGLGVKLVEACLDLARERGAETMGIHSASLMRAACHLYETMGFERCPAYDIQASDALGVDSGSGEISLITYRRHLS